MMVNMKIFVVGKMCNIYTLITLPSRLAIYALGNKMLGSNIYGNTITNLCLKVVIEKKE